MLTTLASIRNIFDSFNIMHKIAVSSFVDFITEMDKFDIISDLVLFRGQPLQGGLLPSVVRSNPTVDSTESERHVLEQLKLVGASMLSGVGPKDLDLLVLGQHYGLKTRLLDWTSNPLAALWFACSDKTAGDVYVYALVADSLLAKDVYAKDPFSGIQTKVIQPRLNSARIVAQQGWLGLRGI